MRQLIGRCSCGVIRFAVADSFEYAAMCHCVDCRRATGSAFKAFAGIESSYLQVLDGEQHLWPIGSETDKDVRCNLCGSLLYSSVRGGAYVHIALGVLEDLPSIEPAEHIFVGSKAAWFKIGDGLPQYTRHVGQKTALSTEQVNS